jgi:uncharacterized protein YycO
MERIKLFLKPYVLKITKPFLILIGKIKMPWLSKAHVFEYFYEMQSALNPGDLILTTSRGHLSNIFNSMFNRGKYMHVGIYIGKENGIPMVVDAIGEGVVKRSLPVFLSDKDKIALVRPKEIIANHSTIAKSNIWLEQQIGKPYDYYFTFNNEGFYCSEIAFFYYKAGNEEMPFARYYDYGLEVKPNDFYFAKKYFTTYFQIN